MANPQYGGWVTFTAHLSLKEKLPVYKIGKTTELYKDGKPRMREFGYGVQYQNIGSKDISSIRTKLVITAVDSHHYDVLTSFPNGTYIVIHDPTEVTGKQAGPLLEQLPRFRIVVIRKSVQEFLKTHFHLKSKFIPHPFYEYSFDKVAKPTKAVSISRVDYDKHTDILLKANMVLPKTKTIDIYGSINRMYVYQKLRDLHFDEYYKGKFEKSYEELSNILETARFVVDMSVIKGDGGGTQYTFLEAIYQECALVINKKWVDGFETPFKQNVNCYVVEDEKELASLISHPPANIQTIIRNGYKILTPHIEVDWIKEMNSIRS